MRKLSCCAQRNTSLAFAAVISLAASARAEDASAPTGSPAPIVAVALDLGTLWPLENSMQGFERDTTFLTELQVALQATAPGAFDIVDPVLDANDPRTKVLLGVPADPKKTLADLGARALTLVQAALMGDAVVVKTTTHFANPKSPTTVTFDEAPRAAWREGLARAASRVRWLVTSDGQSRSLSVQRAIATRPSVPATDFPPQVGNINVTVEAALEKVLDAEKKRAAAAELKRMWCDLVPLTKASSYEARVTRQCAADALWLELTAAREQNRVEDYRLIKELIGLRRRPLDEKKKVLTEFLSAYADTGAKEVKDAEQAKKLLERGIEPDLEDIDKDGVQFDSCPDAPEDKDGTEDEDGCAEDTAAEQQQRADAEVARARQAEEDARAAEAREQEAMLDGLFHFTLFDLEHVEYGPYAQAVTALPPPETLTVPLTLGLRASAAGVDLAAGLTSTRHAPDTLEELLFHGALGVFPFEAPTGTFTLLRPEIALEIFANPLDDYAPFATTVTVSNDLSFSVVHLRPFYRYAFMRTDFPEHTVGVELFVDIVEAGVDDPCFGFCDD